MLFSSHMEDLEEQKMSINETEIMIAKKIFNHMSEGVLITNCNEEIIYVNRSFQLVTGYSLTEIFKKNPSVLQSGLHDQLFYEDMWNDIHQKEKWEGEIWNKRKNGETYPEWLRIHALKDKNGHTTHYIALFSDITDEKHAERRLHRLSHFDHLTGVENRYSLIKKLTYLLKKDEKKSLLAILFIDLDRFKLINDTLGHTFGDALLQQVSHRLKGLLSNDEIFARFCGDEFVVVLPALNDQEEAIQFAGKIIDCFKQPFIIFSQEVFISTSIGISFYPHDGQNTDILLRNADKAMYRAKLEGRNTFRIYESTMHKNELQQLRKETLLRKAIERKELFLVYQPIVQLNTKKIHCFEALIRWRNEELGIVSPAEFIPIAEETGLIIPISEWVIKTACEDLHRIHQNGFPNMKISINISALHFKQDNFTESIEEIMKQTNVKRHHIILELTESMIMTNEQVVINKLVKLKQLGFKLAVDDFGTGYSSLSYLHRFPLDILKIDQSFIKHLNEYKEDAAIVKAIISMASTLLLDTVAEGVESKEQFDYLLKEKCTRVQGYFITKPLLFADLLRFIKEWNQNIPL